MTSSATEPADLTAQEWAQYDAIVAALRDKWPDGPLGDPESGPYFLPDYKYPAVPRDAADRVRIYQAGNRRREWELAQGPRPVAGPVIELGAAEPEEPEEPKEAKYMDWLRALRDDGMMKGLAMTAAVTAIGSRCQASTGLLTFPPRKMAKDWGVNDQTIRSALKQLESSGYIRRIDRGPGKVQHWQLTLPATTAELSPESSAIAA